MATTLPNTGAIIPAMTEAPDQAVNNAAFTAIDAAIGGIIERGVWTPYLAGLTTAGTNTYSVQYGTYYKIGKLVHLNFSIVLTTKDTNMSGYAGIFGLPFTPKGGSYYVEGGLLARFGGITLDSTRPTINVFAEAIQPRLLISMSGSGVLNSILNVTALSNITRIDGSVEYEVA